MTSDNRLKTISSNFFRLSEKTLFSGGCAHPFWKIFLLYFLILVIYLDRRWEGGGSAVPWYIYIDLFFQSIFFLSICLSIYFFLFIYLQRGGRYLYISNYIRYLTINPPFFSIYLFSIFNSLMSKRFTIMLRTYERVFSFLFGFFSKNLQANPTWNFLTFPKKFF